MARISVLILIVLSMSMLQGLPALAGKDEGKGGGVKVDKAKKTVSIDAKIAPRKLEYLKGEIYPIEVIACWPHPKGKKAHETIVTIDALPSAVHKGLEELGLKAGAPIMGAGKEPAKGPEVNIFLEVPTPDGEHKRVSIDKTLVDSRTGKAFPKTVKWRFTGSVMSKPDPNKEETAYGADLSGTLGVIFPVSNQTVFQSSLSMEYESVMKLEINAKILPKEGTPVRLVIEVP
ncbi:MAG: hypothetical protein HY040_16265 [Planctomycetes bacterium]|nr:hypothetical protein [Planctomycetota bacterium]